MASFVEKKRRNMSKRLQAKGREQAEQIAQLHVDGLGRRDQRQHERDHHQAKPSQEVEEHNLHSNNE